MEILLKKLKAMTGIKSVFAERISCGRSDGCCLCCNILPSQVAIFLCGFFNPSVSLGNDKTNIAEAERELPIVRQSKSNRRVCCRFVTSFAIHFTQRSCFNMKPAFIFFVLFASSLSAATKPNVVFIIVDDLATTLSCYGDKQSKTPHMDALAARGVRFDRAYCQFPLCSPSRASFLTGCYPECTKVFGLNQSFREAMPDAVTLPELFQRAGYVTGTVGKVFHGGGPQSPFDVQRGAPLQKDNDILAEAKKANDPDDRPTLKGKGESYNRAYAASLRPDSEFTDYEIAEVAIGTLEQFKDKPFMLTIGFIRPHTPFVAPQHYFDRIDAQAIVLPPFYQANGESLELIPQAALRPNNNVFSRRAPTSDQARDARQAYLASTAFVDAQIGRVISKLGELNLEANTIVLLTGDHGYQLGEHGLWAKQTLFEGATHVPLIVVAPG